MLNRSLHCLRIAAFLLACQSATLAFSQEPPAGNRSAAERLTRKGLALGDHSAQEFNYYVQALQADSRYAPARLHLASWYRAHKQENEALAQYLAALAADPNFAIGHFALAEFLWHGEPVPTPAEGAEPRLEIKPSIRRMELARYHLQRCLDLIGAAEQRTFATEARIMLAAIEGDLAREKNATPLIRLNWDDAVRRLTRPADPAKSPYEGPRLPLAIEFQRGSAAISHGSTYLLDAIARALSSDQLANARILIEGHADSEGDSQKNLDLSKKRAQSVRDYFISRGLQPERFLLAGYGEHRPLVPNDTPATRQKNRRIEVVNWDEVMRARQTGGVASPAPAPVAEPALPAATPLPAPTLQPEVIAPDAGPAVPQGTPIPAEETPLEENTIRPGWEMYQYPSGNRD